MRATPLLPLILLTGAGCASDENFIVVTVESRAAVRDPAMIRVTLSNAGSMRTEDLPLGSATFPATFSISPEERTGELGISIEAFDDDGGLIGRGAAQSTIENATAKVLLEPTDFVVNTEFAEDQQLSNYGGANGLQLAATADGTWTSVYNADCRTPCNVFARRFDATGRPVSSAIAAGTQGFPISNELTTFFSTPAVSTNGTATIAVWNHQDPTALTETIECRALDAAGTAGNQIEVATDEFPDFVAASPLPNGNFVLAWDGRVTNTVIRTAIVRPDCSAVLAATLVSPSTTGVLPRRSHLAANGTNILYAWTLENSVRVRVANLNGGFGALDTELIAKTATEHIEYIRIAPLATGFALVARWAQRTAGTGPGRLDLYRISNAGTVMGSPTTLSDRSNSEFATKESFGLAARPDGTLLVVWHACNDKGDGAGCGVFGRLIRSDGTPAGPEFVVPTTTTNDQTRPSAVALPDGAFAVAWTDKSNAPPDGSGAAVRARIIYPSLDGSGAQ